MRRIVDPNLAYSVWAVPHLKVSPDGRFVLLVTERGHLETGYNEYELFAFDTGHLRSLTRRGTLLRGDALHDSRLARFHSTAREGGISDVKWLPNSESVAFIGRGPENIGQVYVANVVTKALRQLTHHPHDVGSFDVSLPAGTAVYTASEPPSWTARNQYGYAVQSNYVKDLSNRHASEAIQEVGYYVLDGNDGQPTAVDLPKSMVPQNVWMAPSGRWAITLVPPSQAHEEWWNVYSPLRALRRKAAPGEPTYEGAARNPAFGRQSAWLLQYTLIDTRSATASALIDAPSGSGVAGLMTGAIWSTDSSRAVVANIFMPVEAGLDGRYTRTPVVAEVHLNTRSIVPIADVVLSTNSDSPLRLTEFRGTADLLHLGWSSRSGKTELRKTFVRTKKGWREERARARDLSGPSYVVRQSLNTPPDIFAIVSANKVVRLTDLNPQLLELKIGQLTTFSWNTPDGRVWTGGLVLPPNYVQSRRYPLVIQTYGFDPSEFLVDGPNGKSAAFAARALASREIVVAQLPVDPSGYSTPSENANQARLYYSAIDTLDASGIIDPSRVGIIGFSRTGMHVQHAITFADERHPIAAATICDSISNGYVSYVNHYGQEYPGMLSWERMIGAPFWGEGRQLWLERSAAFNLHLVRTPLRLEHLGAYPSDYWDTFALLKRQERPVELFHIPDGTHQLRQPRPRFSSQQGNVDWFDFWLNEREDADASKVDQYERWRVLRSQHTALRGNLVQH